MALQWPDGDSKTTKWTELVPSLEALSIKSEEDSEDEIIEEQRVVTTKRPKRYKLEDYSNFMHHVQTSQHNTWS